MMKHITRQMVADIINSIPNINFDTHKIEQRLLRLHTVAFAEELLEFRNADDPLMRCSAEFSKWVGREFAADIEKSANGKVMTLHLGGDECKNQEWTKLNPGTPIT
jgi:hypothetical protein